MSLKFWRNQCCILVCTYLLSCVIVLIIPMGGSPLNQAPGVAALIDSPSPLWPLKNLTFLKGTRTFNLTFGSVYRDLVLALLEDRNAPEATLFFYTGVDCAVSKRLGLSDWGFRLCLAFFVSLAFVLICSFLTFGRLCRWCQQMVLIPARRLGRLIGSDFQQ